MSQKPKLSVTGYRAIWGQDLNEQIAFEYARSFARMIADANKGKDKVKVLVGRDARHSGPNIFHAAEEALEKEHIEVTYAGILPTPSMLLLTKKLGFDGGIMITASHNPPEYNGVKFIMPDGMLTNEAQTAEIEKWRAALAGADKIPSLPPDSAEPASDNAEFRMIHAQEVLKHVDADLIRSKKFTVALDSINSGGGPFAQELLARLGCEVHGINQTPDGNFAHTPEPLEKNLTDTLAFMKSVTHDVGFVQDPDADRLVLVNERGEFILEELMVSLVIKSVLSRAKEEEHESATVVNLSTTRVCEDVAREYGARFYRTKVGEANVVQKMIEVGAHVGGEGSGGAIFPAVGYFRDSLSGMALVLDLLARDGRKISEIVASFPKYVMQKDKFDFQGDLSTVYAKLKEKFADAEINTLDGVRFDWADNSWVHIRPSNTEPIVRAFGEALDQNRINAIFEQVRLTLGA
ncbi:MAG: phosphoglucosamine mutase [bacterium]